LHDRKLYVASMKSYIT